jgi:hypothetical protein
MLCIEWCKQLRGRLWLFYRLAKHFLRGLPLVMAVGVFSTAYPCIRYAAEAKQYGTDLFFALVLLNLLVNWWARPAQLRWLWLLVCVIPIAVGFSHPAVFVGGGIAVVIAYLLCSRSDEGVRAKRVEPSGKRGGWIALGVYCFLLLASFGLFYFMASNNQSDDSTLGFMEKYWSNAFPPVSEPWKLPAWLVAIHAGEVLAFPVGGGNWASSLTFIWFLAGLWCMWRRRSKAIALMCLMPLALQMIAAAVHRYPYGGHFKFSTYAAPMICIVVGIGMAYLTPFGARMKLGHRSGVVFGLGFLMVVGVGCVVRDFARPYKTKTDQCDRDFARTFWINNEYESEVVCIKSDLGENFSEGLYSEISLAAMYLCNQEINSPRHRANRKPRWDKISDAHPLRCVLYRSQNFEFDETAFNAWLTKMQVKYVLTDRDRYPFPRYGKSDTDLRGFDLVEVFTFVPRDKEISVDK